MSELRDRLVKYAAELRHMAEHHPHLGLLPTQRTREAAQVMTDAIEYLDALPEEREPEKRTVEVPLDDLLDIVWAADCHGYGHSILMSALKSWAGTVTDDEIKAFAKAVLSDPRYGPEDEADAISQLTEWRDR
jgi:hypothetical protein